ncbi:Uncharacterized protein BP5553_02983 [Venustampulla echinocandica]|uniref:pH-response regulator protein palC n=1 Tax=Venustampulla echinocandica TaxID=2656787 RepID=A0A370TT16_9HELO|nr:Uncharacterized protein BP5553_02983 [Venustampulla echinocandica]RDL38643.1 Uncharacterized protein BP5553_02983 [Venustampulla echinocandica]
MPFSFTLPTTSAFSFSKYFTSDSHPSLPLSASTYRGVLRDTLKKHKRLPPHEQSSNLGSVLLSLNNYIPYLLAVDAGLTTQPVAGEEIDVVLKSTPTLEWRPTLSGNVIPGRESARLKINSLEYEIYFVLSTLAYTQTLLSRAALRPLYSSATASCTTEQRTLVITTATKHLLLAASIHDYISTRSDQISPDPPCVDIAKYTFRALSSLAMAEATLLAVLKDDPYPAAVAQARNKNDKDWMIKSPDIPKVRAHLFARLCLAAAEHAANAHSLLNTSTGKGKVDSDLLKYVEDLRSTSRAKACRFLGIDADLGGQTGTGIAWLQAGMHEIGISPETEGGKSGLGFGRFKKDLTEKREDKKVEKGASWGSDAGKLEEARALGMLEKKWTKMNDTINTQLVPPIGPLISTMPSGREIHSLKPFEPPVLDQSTIENMRAPPDRADDYGSESGSDEYSESPNPVGAFPGTKADYSRSSSSSYF